MLNWDAIGALGEIVGAGAVVISLTYLGKQIRTQNRESRIAAMHEVSVGFRESTSKLLDYGVTDIFLKAGDGLDRLTDEELLKLIIGLVAVFRTFEEAFIQQDMGHLDARMWKPMLSYYTHIMSSPAGRGVWELRKEHFDDRFRAFVDKSVLSDFSLR